MNPRFLALAGLSAAALALTACGKAGDLDRPGPLFSNRPAPAQSTDKGEAKKRDPARPVDTVDPRDRALDPAPARSNPIEGLSPDPGGVAPQGALPDPYAYPTK